MGSRRFVGLALVTAGAASEYERSARSERCMQSVGRLRRQGRRRQRRSGEEGPEESIYGYLRIVWEAQLDLFVRRAPTGHRDQTFYSQCLSYTCPALLRAGSKPDLPECCGPIAPLEHPPYNFIQTSHEIGNGNLAVLSLSLGGLVCFFQHQFVQTKRMGVKRLQKPSHLSRYDDWPNVCNMACIDHPDV
jgi:hypothetical protein